MPLPFFGRSKKRVRPAPQRVRIPPDQIDFTTLSIKYQYYSMSSHGVRTPGTHDVAQRLPALLTGFATSPVELIEPLPIDFEDAAPSLVRPEAALQWINAHHGRSPLGRQALFVFESLDVVDLAYETFALALLHGDLDGEGFPRFDAIFGGPISYWDESKGDLVVRFLLGWGGEGIRGDTQRIAQRLLARLMGNLLASHDATELGSVAKPVAVADARHEPCSHCGFPAIDKRSQYCPKCGMRPRA
ncbi:MAG: hypothetical protein QOJ81_2110 [Chloroflexota bacterium]|jgi:hypothetical protein|nr:hypothetical protein [Chloroflexota bacterium]